VAIVEWGDVVRDVLPQARLSLKISQTSEGHRLLEFTVPESLGYLLEGVK